jgi:mannose-6-phosphate isomerase-like protein (cupin superfamily)
MVDYIYSGKKLLAIVIADGFSEQGVHFVTPHILSQQLAFIRHPAGKVIDPHIHNPVPREVLYTQEVLLIKKGRLKVDFYDDSRNFLESRILKAGDVILLTEGGHGFEVMEEIEMIEVKQGPYAGENDKTRFVAERKGSGG